MKRRRHFLLLPFSFLTLATLLSLGGCKKDDSSSPAPSASTLVQQGRWKVTLFQEGSSNETAHFTGYEFQFAASNTVTATRSGSSSSGTWSVSSSSSQPHFNLAFGSTAPLAELNDDWHIVEQTATSLKLQDVSGGNGGTDLLNFEQI